MSVRRSFCFAPGDQRVVIGDVGVERFHAYRGTVFHLACPCRNMTFVDLSFERCSYVGSFRAKAFRRRFWWLHPKSKTLLLKVFMCPLGTLRSYPGNCKASFACCLAIRDEGMACRHHIM